MDLTLRENFIVLTGEKWIDKSNLAERIKDAFGSKKCTVIHYDELYRQAVSSLEGDYTKEKAIARFYDSLARSISVAFMCDSYLVLDTDITSIHDFKGLLHLIEFVRQQIGFWAEKQEKIITKKDRDYELVQKLCKTGPPNILLIKVTADEDTQKQNLEAFYKKCGDELFCSMGDEGRDLAEVLKWNAVDKLEHERVKYAGLLFSENYHNYLIIREARIDSHEDVTITLDL